MRTLFILSVAGLLIQQVTTPPPTDPRVVVIEPQPDSYLTGLVTLTVAVEPESTAVERVDFFVDGVATCRVSEPPFECLYDAGSRVSAHQIRVAVSLSDGRRLVENVRTRGLDLDETVSVNAVLVPVVVWDWQGRFVPGLTQQSFALSEDGVPQRIQFFQAENIPLELAVAIDISDSMTAIMELVKEGVRNFMDRLKPIDRVTLIAFNERTFVLVRSETNRQRQLEAVAKLSPQGGTALFDGLLRSADVMGQQISRRAIVVFSDGKDQDSLATVSAVEERLKTTDVSVYLIAYGKGVATDPAIARLGQLADSTGGKLYAVTKAQDLVRMFPQVIDDISKHYLLGYSPTRAEHDGSYRKIAVTVPTKRSYELKFRTGYQAAKAQ